jgi:hypothetical protein
VAIQSTSALNAYLNAASSAPVDAGVASPTTSDDGALAQRTTASGAEQAVPRDTVDQAAQEELDQTPDVASSAAASLPALYGRNARSVGGGMPARSISLLA